MTLFLSPENIQIANELLAWAHDYLMTENENIKRPAGNQTVCPFVKGSVENNSFYMDFHNEITGHTVEEIEQVMNGNISKFKYLGPFNPNDKYKKALLVIFPKLSEKQTYVLDRAHENIKSKFVSEGLMVGQFHKNCDTRGVYNPGFRVSTSPYPLIAIRHMAIHDIIFIRDVPEWFNHYNLRFGNAFNEPDKIEDYNKHLVYYFNEAKKNLLK